MAREEEEKKPFFGLEEGAFGAQSYEIEWAGKRKKRRRRRLDRRRKEGKKRMGPIDLAEDIAGVRTKKVAKQEQKNVCTSISTILWDSDEE